ncbi:MAG: tetratricopeptide repeat protein [Nitrospinae bacterium]|nr:tetratricopeptide repeat protein [Nitrospinota bacterium]
MTFLVTVALWIAALAGLSACVSAPPPADSHYNRGVAYYDEGKLADAIDSYQLALRQNPKDSFAKYNLAVVYQDQGRLDEAAGLYKEILQAFEDARSRINLAAIYQARGEEDQALLELEKAAETHRDNPHPASVLGDYLERKNRLPEAERRYLEALKIDDKHAVTHFRLGRLYLKQGKTDQGVERLLDATELAPDVPEYLEALGDEYERRDKTLEAIHALEQVSVLQPDRAELFARLGDLYKKKNFYKEAAVRYWTAISIKDDNPAVHRRLKEIFEALTQTEQDWLNANKEQGALARNNRNK